MKFLPNLSKLLLERFNDTISPDNKKPSDSVEMQLEDIMYNQKAIFDRKSKSIVETSSMFLASIDATNGKKWQRFSKLLDLNKNIGEYEKFIEFLGDYFDEDKIKNSRYYQENEEIREYISSQKVCFNVLKKLGITGVSFSETLL